MEVKKEVVQTADGSASIYLPEMDEQYHSRHGAIAESKHIFIEKGLLQTASRQKRIRLFEVGMGTGLNVLCSLLAARDHKLKVDYHTIEAFPISDNELQQLNYPEELGISADLFQQIHHAPTDRSIELQSGFSLTKYHRKLEEFELPASFDLIYFDAFAPEKQPEMWTEAIFEKMHKALCEGGVLTTYCVKGEVRRRLQQVGFKVEKLPGPAGGKREMCRGRRLEI